MRIVNVVWYVCCDGVFGDIVGVRDEFFICLGVGICRSGLEKVGLFYR